MRFFWLIFGLTSVGLGVMGLLLPLLPTVPFMLLAAFCFSRSSECLHQWLLCHRHFGPAIIDWRERGAVSRPVKRFVSVSVTAVFGLSCLIGIPIAALLAQTVVLAAVMVFLWTRPNC